MISFDEVSFAYRMGEGVTPALDRLTFTLERGQTLAVLGANGSGKSTLARLANGLFVPDAGTVTVDGLLTTDARRMWDIRTSVGIVFQNPDNQIVGTVVEEDVAFGPENLGLPRDEIRRRVDEALSAVGLDGLERREPHLLSGGQKQRLAIAGALALQPTYLVLDEPTSMLDPEGRADVLGVIEGLRAAGHGILHVTHDLSDAARADEALVLAQGSAVFLGTPSELLRDADRLAGWGIGLPPIGRTAQALRRLGVPVPLDSLDAEGVVNALCRSN